jgi:hypothetical protein
MSSLGLAGLPAAHLIAHAPDGFSVAATGTAGRSDPAANAMPRTTRSMPARRMTAVTQQKL